MKEIAFIFHILLSITLIILILVQHGKSSDISTTLGSGASNTVFGSAGYISFFVKITAIIALLFFITSIILGISISKRAKINFIEKSVPYTEQKHKDFTLVNK